MASISKQALFEEYEFKIPWWRAISDTSFEISSMKNHWWRGGEHIQTVSLWIIWIKKSVVARWRASFDTSFDKSILKILGGEVASISKQALFEEYEFKIPWWRGGEPFLTLALKYHPWKIIGGEVASTSKQTLFNWIWIRNSLVARLRAINDTSFEK